MELLRQKNPPPTAVVAACLQKEMVLHRRLMAPGTLTMRCKTQLPKLACLQSITCMADAVLTASQLFIFNLVLIILVLCLRSLYRIPLICFKVILPLILLQHCTIIPIQPETHLVTFKLVLGFNALEKGKIPHLL